MDTAQKAFLLLIAVLAFGGRRLFGQTPKAVTCSQATLTKPGVGVSYTGTVTNDDYKFSATIPQGYTGWGGIASDAPFHGFTIFLDSTAQSCILFEVHLRVNDADGPRPRHPARRFSLGQARAWQNASRAHSQEGGMLQLKTSFTFNHAGERDDGEVTLVTPASKQQAATRVYEDFLHSLRFSSN